MSKTINSEKGEVSQKSPTFEVVNLSPSWTQWMNLLSLDEMEHIAKQTGYWTDTSKADAFEAACNRMRYAKLGN